MFDVLIRGGIDLDNQELGAGLRGKLDRDEDWEKVPT